VTIARTVDTVRAFFVCAAIDDRRQHGTLML